MNGTSGPDPISTKRKQIAELARKSPQMVLTTLAHHIDMSVMREAYRRTRKDGAVGIDGQTGREYAANLEANLRGLLERLKSGRYKAPPVKRVYIPKGDGKRRPLGIPTFEDKLLQRAVVMVLEAVYEQDFLDCSYGYRPRRSAHQAVEKVREDLMRYRGGWVIDLDIQDFFGSVGHKHLRGFLDQRVRDGVLRRAIDKWLKAGVMEEGQVRYPGAGTPQGGVISPLLANIYLHEVLDKWFEQAVRPRLRGRAFLVRYADDVVMGFECERDAQRVREVLPKRLARFGLTLHPDKTQLLEFRRPRMNSGNRRKQKDGKRSFVFLGFSMYWGRSRRGYWVVKQRTASKSYSRAITSIARWCRRHRHAPVEEQCQTLNRKLRGHYAYYGVTGNSPSLARFFSEVQSTWRKWLDRRSRKAGMTWERFGKLLKRYRLAPPRVVHSVYSRSKPML